MSFLSDVLGIFKYRKEKRILELKIMQSELQIMRLKAEDKERNLLIQKPTSKEVQKYGTDPKLAERLEEAELSKLNAEAELLHTLTATQEAKLYFQHRRHVLIRMITIIISAIVGGVIAYYFLKFYANNH